MIASSCPYKPEHLERLLDDRLPEAEESVVTEHLAGCETCRLQLEEIAAARPWWREAGRQLRGSEWRDDRTLWLTSRDMESVDELGLDAAITSLDFLESTDNPALLGKLGQYEILDVIGSGGFGIVLKGFDRELNRYVAVKVLAPHLAPSAPARRRFTREAQAAAGIVHPHVVPIHAVNATGQLPYLVMPFIAGESLQQRLDRQGSLSVAEVLRIGYQAALGLAAAHAQGLVHRDIKPANILLEHGVDRVMLTDFGLARAMDDASLTRSTVIAGTPQYMSPEQARGDAVDWRADLFSLGSVLYAMCTGFPPFRAETMLGVLRRVNEEQPRPLREINPDVPEWLEQIIFRLLTKEALRRYGSAVELAALLEKCLAHAQQPTVSPLPPELKIGKPPRKESRLIGIGRRPWVRVLCGSLAVSTLIVAAAFWGSDPDGVKTDPAESMVTMPTTRVPASASTGHVPASRPKRESATPVPAWQWDEVERELQEVSAQVGRLEQLMHGDR